MQLHDWFVGWVSVIAGLVLGGAAAVNSERFFSLAKPRFLSQAMGRTGARIVYAVLGLVFVGLGIGIMLGYRAFR